jgi:hypothetical protein
VILANVSPVYESSDHARTLSAHTLITMTGLVVCWARRAAIAIRTLLVIRPAS